MFKFLSRKNTKKNEFSKTSKKIEVLTVSETKLSLIIWSTVYSGEPVPYIRQLIVLCVDMNEKLQTLLNMIITGFKDNNIRIHMWSNKYRCFKTGQIVRRFVYHAKTTKPIFVKGYTLIAVDLKYHFHFAVVFNTTYRDNKLEMFRCWLFILEFNQCTILRVPCTSGR